MNIIPTHAKPITVGHVGSIEDVLAGHINPSLIKQRLSAADFQYGFELASPEDALSLGESLLVNNRCFTTSTNPQSVDYLQTITGDTFVTSGFFLIPKSEKPTFKIKETLTTPLTMSEYYNTVYHTVKQPFAFAGFFTLSQLHMTAIEKTPIYEEAIFEHTSAYFPHPPIIQSNVTVFLVGIVADYDDTKNNDLLNKLQVVLYQNPFDKTQTLTAHAHAITLNKNIDKVESIHPDMVEKTVHVLSDQTELSALNVEIFTIDGMTDLGQNLAT